MHYLALCHAGRTENCANASISESVAWWQCPAESRLANQRLGCTAAGGAGSDMTTAAGLTFCLQWVLRNH